MGNGRSAPSTSAPRRADLSWGRPSAHALRALHALAAARISHEEETTPHRAAFLAPFRPACALLLLLSDLHLGRGSRIATRDAERDAVAMLRAHEAQVLDGGALVLMGDVYDQYIEYRHLVPKAAPRLVGLLAEWADAGAEVVYVVGNRDPWHQTFFSDDIGVTVVHGAWESRRDGRALYIAHGDGHGRPVSVAARLSHRLRPLLRAPLMARLYRMGLPGDAGYGLARWVATRFGTTGAPDPDAHCTLAEAARERLATTDADLVAFGHSHREALDETLDGTYLNPGYWFGARTFARIDAEGPGLFRWRHGAAEPLREARRLASSL